MLLDFVFELEQLDLMMRCRSLFDSWYDESQASLRESPPLEAECLHCVYSSLRESATTFAVESLRLVRGVTFDLLLLGAVLSTRRLCCMLLSILHCQAMLRKNSGTVSSFESQSCLRLTLIWLKVKKTDRCASSAFHKQRRVIRK